MTDAEIIKSLGGPGFVAKILRITHQRVQNWSDRGIPPAIKLAHPHLFMPDWRPPKTPRKPKTESPKGNP